MELEKRANRSLILYFSITTPNIFGVHNVRRNTQPNATNLLVFNTNGVQLVRLKVEDNFIS